MNPTPLSIHPLSAMGVCKTLDLRTVRVSCYARKSVGSTSLEAGFVRLPLFNLSARRRTLPAQRWTLLLLGAGLLAPFVFAPFVFWAAWVTPGYSHVASTFSDAAAQGQPHPEIMGAGLLVLGLMLSLFAIGCYRAFPRHNRRVTAAILLTAMAIGGTGMFHDYNRSPAVPHNLEGFAHNTFASIATIGATGAIVLTGLAVHRQLGWSHLLPPAILFALGSASCGYLFQTVSDARDGLAERGFATIALSWMAIVALTAIWSLEEIQELRALPELRSEPIPIRETSAPHPTERERD